MATQIQTWQIMDGRLQAIDTSLAESNRREAQDLESWSVSEPEILGSDIALIGRQSRTQSGPLDLLGIDKAGNVVVIELKRDRLPREALTQAIDYASDVASWSIDKLSEECVSLNQQPLLDLLSEKFPDVDIESLSINASQRILLVGFSISADLERMIKWLTSAFDVNINAVILNYTKSSSGDELLTKAVIVSEEEERRLSGRRKFKVPMSDEPGTYEEEELQSLVSEYLSSGLYSAERIRQVLIPQCLKDGTVTRNQLVQGIIDSGETDDQATAGRFVSLISQQLGMAKNDHLRQIISYDYPDHHWQKDNYQIRDEYVAVVENTLADLK